MSFIDELRKIGRSRLDNSLSGIEAAAFPGAAPLIMAAQTAKDANNDPIIETMRNGVSKFADSLTGQDNIYHRSTGKTQKEYEQDLKTYKNLEAATAIGSAVLSTLNGAAAAPMVNAAIAGSGLPAAANFVTDAAGTTVASNPLAPVVYQGLGLTQGGAAALGAAGGLTGALGLMGAEKVLDAANNGTANIVEQKDVTSSSDVTPVEAEEREEEEKEETPAPAAPASPAYDIDEMAGEFILGAWGNGQDRIDNMLNAGYTIDDYNAIQQRVNDAYDSGRDLHEWTNKANEKLHYW